MVGGGDWIPSPPLVSSPSFSPGWEGPPRCPGLPSTLYRTHSSHAHPNAASLNVVMMMILMTANRYSSMYHVPLFLSVNSLLPPNYPSDRKTRAQGCKSLAQAQTAVESLSPVSVLPALHKVAATTPIEQVRRLSLAEDKCPSCAGL